MITAKINRPEYTFYSYIFRTDTNDYTISDIQEEIVEWKHILTEVMGLKSAYDICLINLSSRLSSTLAKTGKGYVVVNSNYLQHHSNPDNFHSTLAHETIHSLVGCFNHGDNFKMIGRMLMNLYDGVRITRTSTDPGYRAYLDKKDSETPKKINPHRYKIVCTKCGQTFYRERMCNIIKESWRFRCGKCGGTFNCYEMKSNGIEVMRKFVTL